MADVTTHDIEANGKRYILEWHHDTNEQGPSGHIAITEACDALEDQRPCDWFINNATVPRWCCNTHMFGGTDYPASGEHPAQCDFAEADTICDSHETHDFKEI